MEVPKSHYVYEFSYPEEMPDLSGIVFYVGKGTNSSRMDHHFYEASRGCTCEKCSAIRSIWEARLVVIRRIVFESPSEDETLKEEKRRILLHQSPYLTNVQNSPLALEKLRAQKTEERDPDQEEWTSSKGKIFLPSMVSTTGADTSDIVLRLPSENGDILFSLTKWQQSKLKRCPDGMNYQVTSVTINPTTLGRSPTFTVDGIYVPIS